MNLNHWLLFALSGVLFCSVPSGAAPSSTYVKASNTSALDNFGYATALSADTMVIGAYAEASSATGVNGNQNDETAFAAGAAYVFVRDGTNWVQQAYLKASNTGPGDLFGSAVAISGDTIVVSANTEDSAALGVNGNQADNSAQNAGAVYVFVRTGTNWSQQAYLKASNTEAGDQFGIAVAISSNTIVVGASRESGGIAGVNGNANDNSSSQAGAAYIFVRNGTNWSQEAYLKSSNPGTNDWFGLSVAVAGATAVVGALREDGSSTGVNGNPNNDNAPDAGAAYVFVRSGTNWQQQAYLKSSNAETNDQFGYSVAISGDTLVVSANQERSNATGVNGNQSDNSLRYSGAAYVFLRNGSNWTQEAYLKASNTAATNYFGESVAVFGDTVVVGAYYESSSSTGVNGNQIPGGARNSGAAYAYVRSGTNWSQRAYLKASNTQSNDWFGRSVAVSGDTVLVGAFGEDSSARGINGNQADNAASTSGAAYVFSGLGLDLRLTIVPDASGGYFIQFNRTIGLTYRLERAPTVTGPWDPIDTQTAAASSPYIYRDATAPTGQAFYRVLIQ